MTTTVLLAGATGMLGDRIVAQLLDQPDVTMRLLIRATALTDPIRPRPSTPSSAAARRW